MDNIKKYGLLRISEDKEMGRMDLKLIEYAMNEIGTTYEYLSERDSDKELRILIEIPIRFPSL